MQSKNTEDITMTIVFISHHLCERVMKEARALKKLGYTLHLLTNRISSNALDLFDSNTYYRNHIDLDRALGVFSDKYIFHVHNEPTWMATVVRTKYPSSKIVLDMHDSNYWRVEGDFSWYEEDVAMQCADALVFTSQKMRDTIEKYGKPHIILPSANLREDFRYGAWHHMGGLVSQGGHSLPNDENPLEAWRDYTALYALLQGRKQVFAYSPMFKAGSDIDTHYIATGAKLGNFEHEDLINQLGVHSWNLVGNIKQALVWKRALPNKFFDAMAAGIPVVNFGCTEVATLVDAFDVGINVTSVDELLDKWDLHREKRYKVHLNRDFFVMERSIGRLTELYDTIN